MKTYVTTLVYVVKDNKVLLGKKKRGLGEGYYNGPGGKVEPGETIEECILRETKEEMGIILKNYEKVAVNTFSVIFKGVRARTVVHTYIARDYEGTPTETDEMAPKWFDLDIMPYACGQMWPDDDIFLPRILNGEKIKGFFKYDDLNKFIESYSIAALKNIDDDVLDVLTEDGEFTNQIVSRDEAHKKGIWHRAVAIMIVNSKGEILLQKRSRDKKIWPGCWDISLGGHVDAGELGEECIIREAEEELGIKLMPEDIRYVSCCRSDRKHGSAQNPIHDRHFNEFYVAFKDADIKDIKLQSEEVEEIKWIPYLEFVKMVKARDKSLTEKWECFDAIIRYLDNTL